MRWGDFVLLKTSIVWFEFVDCVVVLVVVMVVDVVVVVVGQMIGGTTIAVVEEGNFSPELIFQIS